MSRILTPADICRRYGISSSTLYQWTSKNLIPHLKIRGLLRFREAEIDQWEQKSSISPEVRTKLL